MKGQVLQAEVVVVTMLGTCSGGTNTGFTMLMGGMMAAMSPADRRETEHERI